MAKEFSENHPVYSRVGYIVYQSQSVKSILTSLLHDSSFLADSVNDSEKEKQCSKRVCQLFGIADKNRRSLMVQRLVADIKIEQRFVSAIDLIVSDYVFVTEDLVMQSRVPVFDDLVDEVLIDKLDAIAERVIALVFDLRGVLINRKLSNDAELEMNQPVNAMTVTG